MIVYPNAKVNLGLNVLKKRDDGYHEISSVFYPAKDLYDVLEIIPSNEFRFTSSGLQIPGKSNICVSAFKLLKNDFSISNVKIHLHKQIPIGGGLGGGSADGSFTLRVLNDIFKLHLDNKQLENYALKLGADCPFFIENVPKYVTGIGDKMRVIDLDISDYELKFVFSNLHISTKDAFKNIKLKRSSVSLLDIIDQPLENWKLYLNNDFESSIFKRYPILQNVKEKLYSDGAIYASMSGSGSVLYGIFKK